MHTSWKHLLSAGGVYKKSHYCSFLSSYIGSVPLTLAYFRSIDETSIKGTCEKVGTTIVNNL